ncbi:MAG: hypothetical protein NC923_04715 [Candidatus Omnitrophica bacterium]|nr:hypothetical protein [Candidatus Omnitrophota bacterium]
MTRKFFPKIGILNGYIKTAVREYKCQHPWTTITPSIWQTELSEVLGKLWFTNIKLISMSEIDNSFYMIINPFGDSFPEEDKKLHKSFYKICDYIDKGGIFVVTGGAFFSHQNTISSENSEPVIIKTVDGKQSLKDSLLYLEFGVLTTGDVFISNQQTVREPLEVKVVQNETDKSLFGEILSGKQSIKRWRALTAESSNFLPLFREEDSLTFPLAIVKYGKGYLLHAGMYLESADSIELKILLKAIKNLIVDFKIKSKIFS